MALWHSPEAGVVPMTRTLNRYTKSSPWNLKRSWDFRVEQEVVVGVATVYCCESVTPLHLVTQLFGVGYRDLRGDELVVHALSVNVDAHFVLVHFFFVITMLVTHPVHLLVGRGPR